MNACEILPAGWKADDPFYEILGEKKGKRIQAALHSEQDGWLAGISLARNAIRELRVEGDWRKKNGDPVRAGEEIVRFQGTAESILKLENCIIGLVSKPSGIATAAKGALAAAEGRIRVVSGGWKKVPFPIRDIIREAAGAAGLPTRILDPPFIYLDKNYVRIFGGVRQTLEAFASHPAPKVIQVRGEFAPIGEEARQAVREGARIIMVDTGCCEDLDEVIRVVREEKTSSRVQTAFAGGVKIEEISSLIEKGVDILDIGAAILDAPWLEMRYDVIPEKR